MELKPGYKRTELGVIPEDWQSRPLGDLGETQIGLTYHPEDICSFGTLVLRSSNIQNDTLAFEDNIFVNAKVPERLYVRPGDLLICVRNGSSALIGKAVLIDERALGMTFGAFMATYRSAIGPLARFLFQSEIVKRQIAAHLGATINQITNKSLNSFLIPLPPPSEQRAIAAALGDVDALLDGLDRLIAKKRDLKQAAMQQLLTGQTRLPGFHGEWEVKRLGEIGWIFGGLTGKVKEDFGTGNASYVTFMNVMANVVVRSDLFEQVRISATETQSRVKSGDLLFNGSSETPGEVAMCSFVADSLSDVYLNSFCFGFRLHHELLADGLFLAYLIRSQVGRELMKSFAQGSTRYNLSKGALLQGALRLPPKSEQSAIAAVLSDIDSEVAALEARRAKTRDIKQAMMQELLTGRIRLVTPQEHSE